MTDRPGRSALHYAALGNDVTRIRCELAAGADPNAADANGMRPLHFAAQEQFAEAAAALLDAGAHVDTVDRNGNTPLFTAVFNSGGSGALIMLIRAHGADPYSINAHGQTPAGLARLIANYPVAQFFADLSQT